MTNLARTVTHKVTGEQITFLETAAETKGEHLLIEVSLPANGGGPPLHIHDQFEEHFEVVSGQLTVRVAKEERLLQAGESLTAPIGVAHTFRNAHSEPVTFRVKLTPPLQFEQSVRIHYGLMDDGLTDAKGNPKKLAHTALVLSMQNTWVAGIPLWLQKKLFAFAIRRGKATNAYDSLEKYIGSKVEI